MTKLSVNINKIATLRNSRDGQTPNVVQFAKDVQRFGAEGVTVHPRPDERHIRYQDTRDLKPEVYTEFNVEGNPIKSFMDLVLEVQPTQVTLVPDAVDALTSDAGWDTIKHKDFLTEVISEFKSNGIRTSIFVDPVLDMIEGAKATGTDRIELYTESFAHQYGLGNGKAIEPFTKAAELANSIGLGVNAGHDLSLDNIKFFKQHIPGLLEVSIGHALVSESLYLGVENVIQMYLQRLQ
ncbi:pyridoxine 5'-phosphate synthase [Psychroserpens sp. SPM9]|uniref:pyridoxine 5'-phosphate synthase n=1 Tax=Psychroserpens sp. SPM9 TaxID=2975598 RepID=UPI0021A51E4F|nr:pyridoxine 5'-phosphate synthase [Psychroserpens sp. SPM9]MDG5492867.1 pyridoxine 5'-phosphate synthase [Psychroserpens sp. SPM9]